MATKQVWGQTMLHKTLPQKEGKKVIKWNVILSLKTLQRFPIRYMVNPKWKYYMLFGLQMYFWLTHTSHTGSPYIPQLSVWLRPGDFVLVFLTWIKLSLFVQLGHLLPAGFYASITSQYSSSWSTYFNCGLWASAREAEAVEGRILSLRPAWS